MRKHPQKNLDSIPWLGIVAGIVIVIIIVVVVSSWLGGGASPSSVAQESKAGKPGSGSAGTSTTFSAQNTPKVIIETTPLPVPEKGVYVTVEYLGGFSGTYGASADLHKVQSSQNRMYEVVNATGTTVYASFQKDDNTSRHALTVKIYKNGVVLNGTTTYTPFGKVAVTAKV